MRQIILVLASALLLLVPGAPAAESHPNIVLIVADDMGYGDMGCAGSAVLKTPNLDRLAAAGIPCSQGYVASPVCSPSRAGLLPGRDPRRFGYEANLNQTPEGYPTRPECLGLPTNEHTLANHLRRASKLYGDYDGINVLPLFSTTKGPERTLFWRLQGQRAVLHGEDKLIALSHRPPQLFQPKGDPGERKDLAASEPAKVQELFKRLGEWEASLETAPLWDESPRWWRDSAHIYDTWAPRAEAR
jgi:arylsulfatase A-like enzyme